MTISVVPFGSGTTIAIKKANKKAYWFFSEKGHPESLIVATEPIEHNDLLFSIRANDVDDGINLLAAALN